MCAVCGKRGLRCNPDAQGSKWTLQRWCGDTGKFCKASARHCEGPFIREDKVKKAIKDWEEIHDSD